MRHPDGRTTIITVHPGEDIGKGMVRKIINDAKITREEWLNLFWNILAFLENNPINSIFVPIHLITILKTNILVQPYAPTQCSIVIKTESVMQVHTYTPPAAPYH